MDRRKKVDKNLDEALEESFPASDPPAVYGNTSDEPVKDEPEKRKDPKDKKRK